MSGVMTSRQEPLEPRAQQDFYHGERPRTKIVGGLRRPVHDQQPEEQQPWDDQQYDQQYIGDGGVEPATNAPWNLGRLPSRPETSGRATNNQVHADSLAGTPLSTHHADAEPAAGFPIDEEDAFQTRVRMEAAARLQQQEREKLGLVSADDDDWQPPRNGVSLLFMCLLSMLASPIPFMQSCVVYCHLYCHSSPVTV